MVGGGGGRPRPTWRGWCKPRPVWRQRAARCRVTLADLGGRWWTGVRHEQPRRPRRSWAPGPTGFCPGAGMSSSSLPFPRQVPACRYWRKINGDGQLVKARWIGMVDSLIWSQLSFAAVYKTAQQSCSRQVLTRMKKTATSHEACWIPHVNLGFNSIPVRKTRVN